MHLLFLNLTESRYKAPGCYFDDEILGFGRKQKQRKTSSVLVVEMQGFPGTHTIFCFVNHVGFCFQYGRIAGALCFKCKIAFDKNCTVQ